MELKKIKRIGIFKFRNIGDVLMMTPALHALRSQFQKARLTAIVNSTTEAMLKNNPDLDEILVYNRLVKKQNIWSRLRYEINFCRQIHARKFDLTIDFSSGDRTIWYAFFSGARLRAGFRHYTWKRWDWRNWILNKGALFPDLPMHEVEKHSWLLNQIGLEGGNGPLCLQVNTENQTWAKEMTSAYRPGKIVLLHPVSRWLFKCWEDDSVASIIDWLQGEKKATVILTTSNEKREMAKAEKIFSRCHLKPVFLRGETTLSQLAALIQQSDCFLGVDTAPMHIAAAVGTPVVALFGPSNKAQWHPWTDKQISLSKECPCRLQNAKVCDWSKTRDCLKRITVEEVQNALNRFL